LSDSHGSKDNLLIAAERETPHYVLHLGDCERDCSVLQRDFPSTPLRSVRGNCDPFSQMPQTDFIILDSKRILMTHGHLFGVKTGYAKVFNYAADQSADILLFGHTHIPHHEVWQGITILNPGSIGYPPKSYAVIDINDGRITCKHKTL